MMNSYVVSKEDMFEGYLTCTFVSTAEPIFKVQFRLDKVSFYINKSYMHRMFDNDIYNRFINNIDALVLKYNNDYKIKSDVLMKA